MRRFTLTRKLSYLFSGAVVAGSLALACGQADPALAATCGSPVATGTDCTMTGTVSLTGGTLTLTSPSSLSWSSTLTGVDQSLVDTTAADQQYTVDDATGSGSGWHVTISATTFANGASTFPDSGTFSTNGSTSSATATTAPSATCTTTCTLPQNSTTYPVAITTATASPTFFTIYDNAATDGLGSILIGGSTNPNPVGWWVQVPGSAISGSYTSTITMTIISGP
ncbi:MAG TPA: hypothetical protein VN767_14145 [Streptosporangiaceae bacterium]|jgi:hypothetical protein|nr:hypothetical protein [Streptosporangiaceae bacterium]